MPLIENTTNIRLGVMAQDAIAALFEKVKFLKNINQAFDLQPGQRDNDYNVTVVDEGTLTARERVNDADSVTDDEAGVSKVTLTTNQLYTSQPFGQKFMDSTSSRFMEKFVDAQAGKLANAIESKLFKDVTRINANHAATNNRTLGGSAEDISFDDFQKAKLDLNEAYFEDNLSVMLTNKQMQNALALSEFKNFNVVGIGGGSNVSGEPETTLYGFNPQSSTLTRNGNPESVTGDLGANITDTTGTSVSLDNLTALTETTVFPATNPDEPKAIRPGQVIKVNDAEQMLVVSITYSDADTAAATVKRGFWGSTAATATAADAVVVEDSRTSLFYKGSEIIYAFARQAEFNDYRGEKVTVSDPDQSMFLSMFKEPIQGKNGMFRIVTSIDIGFNVIRNNAIIPAVFPY